MKAQETGRKINSYIVIIILLLMSNLSLAIYGMYSRDLSYGENIKSVYFISNDGTYKGVLAENYVTGPVEIRSHVKLFYSFMFSFTADSYEFNTNYAKDNLVDLETGVVIQRSFDANQIHSKLLRIEGGEILTVVKSEDIEIDMEKEPYRVRAYCTQYIFDGTGKSEIKFVNEFEIVASGIRRNDLNPHGLQLRKWRNIEVD